MGADTGVSGFCEAAAGGADRSEEVRELRKCKPAQTVSATMRSTVIGRMKRCFGDSSGGVDLPGTLPAGDCGIDLTGCGIDTNRSGPETGG